MLMVKAARNEAGGYRLYKKQLQPPADLRVVTASSQRWNSDGSNTEYQIGSTIFIVTSTGKVCYVYHGINVYDYIGCNLWAVWLHTIYT